ncbi:HNH endonuclease signature motif containing protein [Pectobacterium carotovorum]|uniref:HNH endonuclease n=1 Tax=Pectobacterium carotovorum TaxID=554 RepID=UPI0029DA8C12|nr:HNH endonuclease signature motif containing protein [Pectobacterium carotovorum]MDX6917595.1 HNH endonuclease signature motif containing protein [Pectobacterium carotovorum]
MAKKTTMKEILELSPYLFVYLPNKQEVKNHVKKLISEGLEASEVLHQVQLWMANNRKPPKSTSAKKIEYAGQFSVRTNAAGTISMKDTLKLPPYRRGEKMERLAPPSQNLPSHPNSLPTTELQRWLLSLDEYDRRTFTNWCARQGKIVGKHLWEEFKFSQYSIQQVSEPLPTFEQRSYVEDGYSTTKVRKSQGKFRKDVLANWRGCCAITGTRFAIDACHILSHASGGVPSVENGIALASDLHRLLDSGHLRIESNRAIFSDEARKDPRYKNFHGRELNEPLFPVKFS